MDSVDRRDVVFGGDRTGLGRMVMAPSVQLSSHSLLRVASAGAENQDPPKTEEEING